LQEIVAGQQVFLKITPAEFLGDVAQPVSPQTIELPYNKIFTKSRKTNDRSIIGMGSRFLFN
jgi:hypothetical protein